MKSSSTVLTAQALFTLNALIWMVLGIISLGKIGVTMQLPGYVQGFIAILMFGNAGAMFLSGWGLGKGNRWYYYLALTVLSVNILLTQADQVGLLDWVTFGIDIILLGLLWMLRKEYSTSTRR